MTTTKLDQMMMNPMETNKNTDRVQRGERIAVGATLYAYTASGDMVWGTYRGASPQYVALDIQGYASTHDGADLGPTTSFQGHHRASLPGLLITHRYEPNERGVPIPIEIARWADVLDAHNEQARAANEAALRAYGRPPREGEW